MQMERRQEERRKALEQEASFVKAKGRFFGVEFSDGEICIKVLDSVEAIRQEGEAMHHCVFTNEYLSESRLAHTLGHNRRQTYRNDRGVPKTHGGRAEPWRV